MKPYSVIVADDHALIREGVKSLIAELEGLMVAGEAADGLNLLKLVRRVRPDLVILDIVMPGMQGIDAAKEIKALHPDIAILFLSMHKRRELLEAAIAIGAEGFVLKENTGDELIAAIHAIRKGETYLSPVFLKEFPQDIIGICRGKKTAKTSALTRREEMILKLIAEGNSDKEIGELLHISVRTVQTHHQNIHRKLGSRHTADLVRYAIGRGLIV